jgi:hypothetical protein
MLEKQRKEANLGPTGLKIHSSSSSRPMRSLTRFDTRVGVLSAAAATACTTGESFSIPRI